LKSEEREGIRGKRLAISETFFKACLRVNEDPIGIFSGLEDLSSKKAMDKVSLRILEVS
jgi:hypothetical protein